MAETEIPRRAEQATARMYVLSAGTLVAAALAVCVALLDPQTLTGQEISS